MSYTDYEKIQNLPEYKLLINKGWKDVSSPVQRKNEKIALHHPNFTNERDVKAVLYIDKYEVRNSTPLPNYPRPIAKKTKYYKQKYKSFKYLLKYVDDHYSIEYTQLVSKRILKKYREYEKMNCDIVLYSSVRNRDGDPNDYNRRIPSHIKITQKPYHKGTDYYEYETHTNQIIIHKKQLCIERSQLYVNKTIVNSKINEFVSDVYNNLKHSGRLLSGVKSVVDEIGTLENTILSNNKIVNSFNSRDISHDLQKVRNILENIKTFIHDNLKPYMTYNCSVNDYKNYEQIFEVLGLELYEECKELKRAVGYSMFS